VSVGNGWKRAGHSKWQPHLLASWLVLVAFLAHALAPAACCWPRDVSPKANAGSAGSAAPASVDAATAHCARKPSEQKTPGDQHGSCDTCLAACCDVQDMARSDGPVAVPPPITLPVAEALALPQWLGGVTERASFANRSRAPPIPT
jgi:hypothetical protein